MADEVAKDPKPRGQRRKAAASAVGAAKGTGEAAPVVAPAAYVAQRRRQKKEERAAAAKRTREGGGVPGGRERLAEARAKGPSKPSKAVTWVWSGSRRLLAAEFVLCVAVLLIGHVVGRVNAATLKAQAKAGKASGTVEALSPQASGIHVMVKGSALAAVFFLLALVASGGKGPAKVATGLGTLITATYVFTSADVHAIASWAAVFFKKPTTGAG